ncbi:MAG: hypothetical protein AUK54_08850 [Helicobacteraceae bacterium CG2_30_36_10]|nr:MAG: hypothetical protein AUK54_08850 [Helicobacteraceae bacterium CG2_30_36_10]
MNVNLTPVIDTICDYEHLIEYDYNNKEDQIFITKELKTKIFSLLDDRELIKTALRQVLELKNSDIVIIKTDGIFIKIFDDSSRHQVAKEEKNTIANRYNGIDEEELKSFYTNFFTKEENGDFCYTVAEEFVKTYFLEQQIDNETYEKNVFSYIQAIITNKLLAIFDNNSDFFNGFSGYIFRIKFKEVFGYIATLILKEVARSSPYMNEFLKYYSQNIIVVGGEKYKVPVLEAESGLKWNVISILSIVKIYVKIETSIQTLKQDMGEIDDELFEMQMGDLSPVEYHTLLFKEKEVLEHKIAKGMAKMGKYRDSLQLAREENDRAILTDKIKNMKQDMQDMRDKKAQLTSLMPKKNILTKYSELEKELATTIRLIKAEEAILAKNKVAYQSIKGALIKALTSKKQKL